MSLTPDETSDVNFAVRNLLEVAQKLPCRDAVKLLHGFLLVAGPDEFPEIRALFRNLHGCDAQLELLAKK